MKKYIGEGGSGGGIGGGGGGVTLFWHRKQCERRRKARVRNKRILTRRCEKVWARATIINRFLNGYGTYGVQFGGCGITLGDERKIHLLLLGTRVYRRL
jgi:hypothetical protein